MGCFAWLFRKKKKNRKKRKGQKEKGQVANPHGSNDLPGLKATRGGVAFNVELRPPSRAAPPMRHKFVDSLKGAEQRKVLAEVRKLEEMVRKGEAAQEADRRRAICLEKKAENEKQFVEKAKHAVASQVLPSKEGIKANMKKLDKRCQTARTRRKVSAVLKFGDGGKGRGAGVVSPSPASN